MRIEALFEVLARYGVTSGAGVPCSYFTPLVNHTTTDPRLDYISAASEGEAVAIAAGMVAAGQPAFALMQNSGLGNAVNPITSLLYIYRIPVLLFVSQRGQPGLKDEPQHELMGRITEQLASLCELHSELFDEQTFEASVKTALAESAPAAWIVRKGQLEGGPKIAAPPLTLAASSGLSPEGAGQRFAATLSREQALEALLPLLSNGLSQKRAPAVIATTGKLSRELYELDDRDHTRHNRFYMVGSMGCAAAFGLGVARAQPKRQVLVLDGDGALLMKMGTLATAGQLAPTHFHHVVFDNGVHDSTGGQPTSSSGIDSAIMALAAGYRHAATVSEKAALLDTLSRQLEMTGPTFLRVAVTPGARADLGRPKRTPRQGWQWFTQYLAQGA
jgi:phosphonopyruvate decarboxylase